MTAANGNQSATPTRQIGSVSDAVIRRIERVCRWIIEGRQAARALGEWTRRFAVSEVEFQLLWCLRPADDDGFDQTTLARKLAISPAQVSATVEQARSKGWICQQPAPGDRRRNLWRLTTNGRQLLDEMLDEISLLRLDPDSEHAWDGSAPRKAAA